MSTPDNWRKTILLQLQHRNKVQTYCFQGLVQQCNKLFDNTIAQPVQTEKPSNQISSTEIRLNDTIELLKHKLLAQQEELTELLRRKGENAQNIIDLNNKLQEKEKDLDEKHLVIKDYQYMNTQLQSQVNRLSNNIKELEKINSTVRDEYTTLRLEFSSIEDKLRKLQDENMQLMEALMAYKSKDADKLNEENDNFVRKKAAKVQKDIEDACRDSSKVAGLVEDAAVALNYFTHSALPSKQILTHEGHEGEILAVKFNPNDRMLATGGSDRVIKLWSITSGMLQQKGILTGSNAGVNAIDFNLTGNQIIGAFNDRACRIWNTRDFRTASMPMFHSDKVLAARFLGDGDKVITGSMDRTIRVWDARKGDCVDSKFAGSYVYDLVTVDNRGTTIISGHHNKCIYFWDLRSKEKQSELAFGGRITSLDLKRESNLLLCCIRDENTLKVLDLRMNEVLFTFCSDEFKIGLDTCRATVSPDGRWAAAGSAQGTVFIWAMDTAQLAAQLKQHHKAAVSAVAWNPDGTSLVSVDRAKTIVVWGE